MRGLEASHGYDLFNYIPFARYGTSIDLARRKERPSIMLQHGVRFMGCIVGSLIVLVLLAHCTVPLWGTSNVPSQLGVIGDDNTLYIFRDSCIPATMLPDYRDALPVGVAICNSRVCIIGHPRSSTVSTTPPPNQPNTINPAEVTAVYFPSRPCPSVTPTP